MDSDSSTLSEAEIDRAFRVTIYYTESGGRQFGDDGAPLRSSAGAIGASQLMPDTGPEAAGYAGLEWDPGKFLYDAPYNLTLGHAYFHQLASEFGSIGKAYAAYYCGPQCVKDADTRSQNAGEPDQWLGYINAGIRADVQSYVAKNMAIFNGGGDYSQLIQLAYAGSAPTHSLIHRLTPQSLDNLPYIEPAAMEGDPDAVVASSSTTTPQPAKPAASTQVAALDKLPDVKPAAMEDIATTPAVAPQDEKPAVHSVVSSAQADQPADVSETPVKELSKSDMPLTPPSPAYFLGMGIALLVNHYRQKRKGWATDYTPLRRQEPRAMSNRTVTPTSPHSAVADESYDSLPQTLAIDLSDIEQRALQNVFGNRAVLDPAIHKYVVEDQNARLLIEKDCVEVQGDALIEQSLLYAAQAWGNGCKLDNVSDMEKWRAAARQLIAQGDLAPDFFIEGVDLFEPRPAAPSARRDPTPVVPSTWRHYREFFPAAAPAPAA